MSLNKIKVIKLNIIKNSKGDILKYLNKNDTYSKKFGETYFSEIKYKSKKGWIFHKKSQSLLTVPFGKVKFTFMDKFKKKKRVIIIGKTKYFLIVLPPKIWFNFTSLDKLSLVVNTLNNKHNDKETLKLPLN
jgi:dTDP-4-dehydrorhamnose 3,5-epimerase-like enzyme